MEIIKATYIPDIFFRKLEDFEMSTRAYKALTNNSIIYMGDLVQKPEHELLRVPNFGRKSLREIKELLSDLGLELGMEIENWNPENIKIATGDKFNSDAEILRQLKILHIRLNEMSDFLSKIEDSIYITKNNN